ncbi:hypothetical protein [Sphingomonas albertensis]|uniref:Uncharacterized protein n=1 Tax=Sphingomonas albertensis TaxID=2762591 RepID=A0ABR7AQB3_9SPHN|nr:hypothetical protein [Sphingomonas albertensis]MBC3942654.1 hypothetical protein [Sphingomonas albertensis]
MLKTMLNMPAKLMREANGDDDAAQEHEPVASGSLVQMVEAFTALDPAEVEGLVIKCAGRDRPITSAEVRDLRLTAAAV